MPAVMRAHSANKDLYGLKLLASLTLLMLILASSSYYLFQNYYSNTFLEYALTGKKVYFLESENLKEMYSKNNMDYDAYQLRIKHFKQLCLENGYEAQNIESDGLSDIDKNTKLIALDMMSLSSEEIHNIDTFVSRGGRLLFNFTSGFLDESLKYQSNNLVSKITGLSLDKEINTIKQDPKNVAYLSTKMLSPITKYLPEAKSLSFDIYDPVPIFNSSKNAIADAYITNWSQSNYIKYNKSKNLNQAQSSVIWHGNRGSGKWIYFNFPSYLFVDGEKASFTQLFKGMLEYLDNDISAIIYPYIDAKNVVFISEDTEYKYTNLQQFHDVSLKNKFPVTAFCVAELAKKHEILQAKVAKSPYLEIGSHSYTHKKIVGQSEEVYERETKGSKVLLDSLSSQVIRGFRAPREEIDDKMLRLLQEAGFKYILNAGESRLSTYFKDSMLIIPRHGTDDYSYLINLDWTASQILEQMKREVNVLVALNAMYTMSTHTHLMSFSTNVNIINNFMKYINSQKQMSPMNGTMIYDRLSKIQGLTLQTTLSQKKLIMTLKNSNATSVNNIHYELDVGPNIKLTGVESEMIGVKAELIQVSPHEYTLIVKALMPKSEMLLFVNYEKNI